jgi:shikimate kinase
VILTGFMGSGKTTVGRLLSDRLEREFLDADEEIEKRNGMSVSEIFRTMGEPRFRQLEKDLILDLCTLERCKIISLGGGAYMQEQIREACLSSSIVIFLELSWDAWKQRLPNLKENRPILQQRSPEEIKNLFDVRQHAYAMNHAAVLTDRQSPEETTETIAGILQTRFGFLPA